MSQQSEKIRNELSKLQGQQKWVKMTQWLVGLMLLVMLGRSFFEPGHSSADSAIFPILCLCVGWLGMLTQSFHSSITTLSNIMLEQLEEVV